MTNRTRGSRTSLVERALRDNAPVERPSADLRRRILDEVGERPSARGTSHARLGWCLAAAVLLLLGGVSWVVVSSGPRSSHADPEELRSSIRTVVASFSALDDRVTRRVTRGIATLVNQTAEPGRWALGEARDARERTQAVLDAFERALSPDARQPSNAPGACVASDPALGS
ncbi:MAG: hypothetical protein H6811_03985 [Phycisphaeraceae bacterium]|nr:hypothetical protein [Phycisphaeraceae bacterium]